MITIKLPMAPIQDPASINIYVLEGDPLTLVDTGFKTEAAWKALNQELEKLHISIHDIKQVVLTHAHGDHYGLANRIRVETNAIILAHADAVPRFLFWFSDWERGNRFLFETLLRTGAPEDPLSRRLAPKEGREPLVEPVEISSVLKNGDFVTRGGEQWQVIELPGHAPGIIGLYRPRTRELITSDTLLPDTNSRPVLYMPTNPAEPRHPYMAEYLPTLEKIANMDLKTAWPAHGERIDQVAELTYKWIEKHHNQAKMFVETLKDGQKTAYEVWKAVFPRVLPFDPVKGLIEVISYLDVPVNEGLVESFQKEGNDYYQLIK